MPSAPCQQPGALRAGRLALILAPTAGGLCADPKMCLALALAERVSGLGGQKGAGSMLCYETLEVMRAWPGPLESCAGRTSAQHLVWDTRASPDAAAVPRGRAPRARCTRGRLPSHPSASGRCPFTEPRGDFSGCSLRGSPGSSPDVGRVRCARRLLGLSLLPAGARSAASRAAFGELAELQAPSSSAPRLWSGGC